MTKTYFSADSHYNHARIIELCHRPFATVEMMNAALIQRWNATVTNDDEVWFLGDFGMKNPAEAFHQLNGRKHLIVGNHDHRDVLALPWLSQQHYRSLKLADETGKLHTVILSHYPFEEWDGYHKGTIHLYGHVHGRTLNPIPRRVDVGVDVWNFTPITWEQILADVASRTIIT